LAEVTLCKALGWEIGFVSGGHDAYTTVEFGEILRQLSEAAGEKLWINVGALKKEELQRYLPHSRGVVASIETVNPRVHDFICPSKPIEPFEEMFEHAEKLGLKKAMTIILGVGETIDDFKLLKMFLEKNKVEKIHFYSLTPHKGTHFEHVKRPSAEYQATWIAKTRIEFPRMEIQAGIWLDCVDRVSLLLRAGANSISKFPAIRYFNSSRAREIERHAGIAGRRFVGTLTRLPDLQMHLRPGVQRQIEKYIKLMARH